MIYFIFIMFTVFDFIHYFDLMSFICLCFFLLFFSVLYILCCICYFFFVKVARDPWQRQPDLIQQVDCTIQYNIDGQYGLGSIVAWPPPPPPGPIMFCMPSSARTLEAQRSASPSASFDCVNLFVDCMNAFLDCMNLFVDWMNLFVD